ncbi:hypothetical protein SLS56_001833 [Neofusicoccum ribis]|uniref:Uncharacterized protein n=1 Tax=Neofusicoccum ribis TaxID=45134 RepID=A0ABR3T6T2_9PEZI
MPTRESFRQRATDPVNQLAAPEFLLSTPIKVLANKWLMDDKWDASFSFRCFLLFSSTKLLDRKDGTESFLREVLERGFNEKRIPLKLIQNAGNLALEILNLAPEKVFLRRAETYVTEKSSREAIKILPNGTDYWRTSWCYARAFNFTHQQSKALLSLEMVITKLETPAFRQKYSTEWAEMVDTLCKWYKEAHAYEKALKLFRRLQTAFPTDKSIMKRALQWVEENCDSRGLAKYLSIGQTAPVELFSSHATDPYFHHSICMALEKDLRSLDQVYNDSIETAYKDLAKRISLRYYHGLALFYQYQTGRTAKAWNENISDKEHLVLKSPERRDELLLSLIKKLQRYDTKSLEYLEKIKDLKLWNDRALANTPHSLALLLGRAVYLMEGSAWVKNWCVREHIQKSMELLSDDKIFNDWEGYWLLCQAFIPLEDDANALAAWSLIVDDYFYMNRGCAGGCGCTWYGWADSDMYVCRDCADVQFDEPCWLRLKDGKLEEHVCGKHHKFIVLPRWEAAAAVERLGSQTVNVGGVEKNIDEWKRDVRRQYGLELEEKTGRLRSLAKRFSHRK